MAKWTIDGAGWVTKQHEYDDYHVEGEEEVDNVNEPPHYGNGEIECIDYMKDNMDPVMFMGYLEGNAKKYLHRYRYKDKPLQDLRKAQWYLDRLIEEMEGE